MEKIQIGNATLYHGDCFDVLSKLDVTADAVITDMPFGITAAHWDKVPPLDAMWRLLDSRTKPTANFVMFACGKFSFDLMQSKLEWYRYDWIWAKNNQVGFLNARKQPMRSHEQVLIFGRPGHRSASTYHPVKSPGGRVGSRSVCRKPNGIYGTTNNHASISNGMTHPGSVLAFPHERGNGQQGLNWHPTQKPVRLMEFLIKSYTNVGDTVLDCFMGSGSTAVAARNLNRKFIGIEKEQLFFDAAIERLKAPPPANLLPDEHVGLALFSANPEIRVAS